MASLAKLPTAEGVAAMQSINRVILASPFMVLFFTTTLSSAAMVVLGIINWGGAGGMALVIAGDVYVIGMFGVTAAFNVPLNTALDAVDPKSHAATDVWHRYLRIWTRWNHLRTVASLLSTGLFIYVIVLFSRS